MSSRRRTLSFRLAAGASVLALGALSTAAYGCGSDEYRCDSTGCYECDGYGCRPVEAPQATPCGFAGDPSCKAPEVCTDIGCLQPCKDDASCPKGTVCGKTGYCASPTKTPEKKVCGLAADCPSGSECIDGACVAVPPCSGVGCSCRYSSECGEGRICVDSKCASSCDAIRPCATGMTCDASKGICVVGAPTCGAKAPVGASCKAAEHCVDGRCVAGCGVDSDCKGLDGKADPSQRCVGGACVPDDRTHPKCAGDTECTTGTQKCLDGFCRYTCATDDACKAIDSRIGACSSTEGICRAPSEINAKCTSKAQCLSTQSCVDGQCK